jgi:hypothetical protein
VQSPCNPLIEDHTQLFYIIGQGDIPSFQCKVSFQGPKSARKVDGLSLIFIDSYVPALKPHVSGTETSLQLSENVTLFAVCDIMCRCHQQRDLDRHPVLGVYHLYMYCTLWGQDRTLWHLCLYIPRHRHLTFNFFCERKELIGLIRLIENFNLDTLYS